MYFCGTVTKAVEMIWSTFIASSLVIVVGLKWVMCHWLGAVALMIVTACRKFYRGKTVANVPFCTNLRVQYRQIRPVHKGVRGGSTEPPIFVVSN